MSIEGITRGLRAMPEITQITQPDKPKGAESGKGFNDVLTDALKEVDDLQKSADQQIEGLTLGKDGFTSHGAAIALEKADIAFQLMNTIRAKIIRAYEEVIRTQV